MATTQDETVADQAAAETHREKAKRAASPKPTSGPREGSMAHAMLRVLKDARGPLGAREITERIQRRGLAPNLGASGKTPAATVSAKLSIESRKSDGLFVKVSPGRYEARA